MNKMGGGGGLPLSKWHGKLWPEDVNVPKTNSYRKSSSPVSVCIRASTHIRWLKQIEYFSFCAVGRDEEEEKRGWWSTMNSERVMMRVGGVSERRLDFFCIHPINRRCHICLQNVPKPYSIFLENIPYISELISMRTVSGPHARSTPSQGADWS